MTVIVFGVIVAGFGLFVAKEAIRAFGPYALILRDLVRRLRRDRSGRDLPR